MYKRIVIPVILLFFVLQTSCLLLVNENSEAKTEESTETSAEADVVATVNGEKVFRKDFDRRMNVIRRMNQEVTRSTEIMVVKQLAMKVLLKQFVKEQNIDVSDNEVQGEVEKIKYFLKSNPNNSEKPLEEILKAQESSISELEDEVRRTLALSKYLDTVVSDDEKRSYFDANKSAFNGEKVKASHVLIDTTKLETDAELEKARQKIEEIKKELDNGADFAEMARKYSTCPSAESNATCRVSIRISRRVCYSCFFNGSWRNKRTCRNTIRLSHNKGY